MVLTKQQTISLFGLCLILLMLITSGYVFYISCGLFFLWGVYSISYFHKQNKPIVLSTHLPFSDLDENDEYYDNV